MVDSTSGVIKLTPNEMEPSIWNIVPRAMAFFHFLKQMPISGTGRVYSYGESIIITPDPNSSRYKFVKFLLSFILPKFNFRIVLLSIFGLITISIIILFLIGKISFIELVLSLFVEVAGISLSSYIEWRRKR
jgi:hypothetical protein